MNDLNSCIRTSLAREGRARSLPRPPVAWRHAGFTLIEAMIVVAIVAILAAVALPSYQQYVIRSRLTEAQNTLVGIGIAMQQYYQDNRSYVGSDLVGLTPTRPCELLSNTRSEDFDYVCSPPVSALNFTLRATAKSGSVAAGAVYTLDQDGVRKTVGVPKGWTTPPPDCWVRSPTGAC